MSPQILVLMIAFTIGFSALLYFPLFLLYICSLQAELDVHAPLLDDLDAAKQSPFPLVAAEGAVHGI